MSNYDKVRIQVAKAIAKFYHCYPEDKLAGENAVSEILSNPLILIKADNQELPDKNEIVTGSMYSEVAYDVAREEMINAGWIKCEVKK